jgi:hypothetical protein
MPTDPPLFQRPTKGVSGQLVCLLLVTQGVASLPVAPDGRRTA